MSNWILLREQGLAGSTDARTSFFLAPKRARFRARSGWIFLDLFESPGDFEHGPGAQPPVHDFAVSFNAFASSLWEVMERLPPAWQREDLEVTALGRALRSSVR